MRSLSLILLQNLSKVEQISKCKINSETSRRYRHRPGFSGTHSSSSEHKSEHWEMRFHDVKRFLQNKGSSHQSEGIMGGGISGKDSTSGMQENSRSTETPQSVQEHRSGTDSFLWEAQMLLHTDFPRSQKGRHQEKHRQQKVLGWGWRARPCWWKKKLWESLESVIRNPKQLSCDSWVDTR